MNIYQKLNEIQKKISYLQKDKKVETGGGKFYWALTHDKVVGAIRPYFVEQGIITIPIIISNSTEKVQRGDKDYLLTSLVIKLRFINTEKPDEYFDSDSFSLGLDNSDKGPGKALSYAVKYALLKTLMIESGDEEEDRIELEVPEKKQPVSKNATPYFKLIGSGISYVINDGMFKGKKIGEVDKIELANWIERGHGLLKENKMTISIDEFLRVVNNFKVAYDGTK